MKNALYILCFFMWSCGGGSDDAPPPENTNQAPTVPTLVYPTNNLLCTDNAIDFQWDASNDVDNDPITYVIQISTDNQFGTVNFSRTASSNTQTFALKKGVAYYWRVKATDNQSAESNYSSVFNFYTEGDAVSNHLPFAPHVINPVLNTEINAGTINLKWAASDIDRDALTFDVYFGTENPPVAIISKNQTGFNLNVSTNPAKNYYWKVVVKDNYGSMTIGRIWHFKTN